MDQSCHECISMIENLNKEHDLLYFKYNELKEQRYDDIIKDLFFKIYLKGVMDLDESRFERYEISNYLEKDDNGKHQLFNVIRYFQNEYNIQNFDEYLILLHKLTDENMEQFDLIGEDDLFHCIIYEKLTIDMEKECIECLINIDFSTHPFENEDIITCDDIQRMEILNNKICPTWFKKVCDCHCKICLRLNDGFG